LDLWGQEFIIQSDHKAAFMRSVKNIDVKSEQVSRHNGLFKVASKEMRNGLTVESYPRIGLELSQG
jgi:formate dehydrogenase assembly factor FdhD